MSLKRLLACALKHNTPCGVAIAETPFDAYKKAHDVDPTSIFGGIVAINKKIDKATAEEMNKNLFRSNSSTRI